MSLLKKGQHGTKLEKVARSFKVKYVFFIRLFGLFSPLQPPRLSQNFTNSDSVKSRVPFGYS